MTTKTQIHDRVVALVDDTVAVDGPGVAVGVVSGDEVVARYCRGLADLEWQQPVTPDTVFRIASLTKPFTATVVVLLAQDGLVDLDATVDSYVPGHTPHGDRITVRQLLNHTAGIPNFLTVPSFLADGHDRHDLDAADTLAMVAALPLDFEPGSRFGYSNSGYRLLELLVETVTGRSYPDLVEAHVTGPLGMRATSYPDDREVIPRRARGYSTADGTARPAAYMSPFLPGGAGGLVSTLDDLLRWHRALREGGAPFGRAALASMWAPATLTDGRSVGYGLGWEILRYRGRQVVCHSGGIYGFACFYGHLAADDPAEDLGLVVLANDDDRNANRLARRIAEQVLDDPPQPAAPVSLSADALARRAGRYRDTIRSAEVESTGDALLLHSAVRELRLVPVSEVDFVAADDPEVTLRFHDDEGAPTACTLAEPFFSYTAYREG